MPQVEQELLTLPIFSGVLVTRSLALCVCFVDRCPYSFGVLAMVLSAGLRFTDSDYPFGIFKLFLIQFIFIYEKYFIYAKISPWNQ
jgi:hypothetical protein